MVSDLVAIIGRIINAGLAWAVLMAIILTVTGYFAHRLASSIQSGITLTVSVLFLLLLTLGARAGNPNLFGYVAITALVVFGHEAYHRLLVRYQ